MSELSVEILPSDDDTEAIKTNNTWRICEGMPILFFVLTTIGLFTIIRHDSPRFYLYSSDKWIQAKKAIHKMYITNGSDRTAGKIGKALKKTSTAETNKVTLKQAFISEPKYVRASWISVMTMTFCLLDG